MHDRIARERYDERVAALALLASRDKGEYERVTTEYRERRNAQQQARRQQNKLASRLQAMKLLKRLEAELASGAGTGNKKKKEKDMKYGTADRRHRQATKE
jgi:hypothetical protein